MREKYRIWFWLIEPEDSSSRDPAEKMPSHLKGNAKKKLSIAKFLLWYGAGVFIGLAIARLH
jgi:hypothetical protein